VETRLLEYLVAVAQEGGFTRAAERCHAAQSTVSAGIRALESDLGVVLFERDTRRVTLTPAGTAVLPMARELLDQLGRLRDAASDDGVLRGTLRVGTLTNVVAGMRLSTVLGRFQAQHPGVDLQLSPSPTGSAGLARDLADGRIDLAFLGGAPMAHAELETERLGRSAFVAILPVGHPLAERDVVPLAELVRLPFVDSPEGFGNRTALDVAIAARGLTRRTTIEIADVAQMPLFVAAGLGVAVMPRSLVPSDVAGVDLHPLDAPIEWELLVATRRRPSAAAKALRAAIAAEFARD
jgi:DNA-binding transcriptional LysR family regulator